MALHQIAICCDRQNAQMMSMKDALKGPKLTIIDYIMENTGLDKQLNILFDGVINRKLVYKDFEVSSSGFMPKKEPAFDPDKLRLHLTIFLRFMIQLCLCEVSMLK